MSSDSDPELNSTVLDRNGNPIHGSKDKNDGLEAENLAGSSTSWSNGNGGSLDQGSSTSDCQFDGCIKNLNQWVWQCQTWISFHNAYQSSMLQQTSVAQPSTRDQPNGGTVYRVPRLRKRIMAGLIDYFILCFLYDQMRILLNELFDMGLPSTTMDLKDMEQYLPEDDDNFSDMALKLCYLYITFFLREFSFFIFYCIYETVCVYGLPGARQRGTVGATVGKLVAGLRVVRCRHFDDLGNDLVRVSTAGNLTLWHSLARAVSKLSPLLNTIHCLNVVSSRYHQSYYDTRANLMVVEVRNAQVQPPNHR